MVAFTAALNRTLSVFKVSSSAPGPVKSDSTSTESTMNVETRTLVLAGGPGNGGSSNVTETVAVPVSLANTAIPADGSRKSTIKLFDDAHMAPEVGTGFPAFSSVELKRTESLTSAAPAWRKLSFTSE